MRSATQDELDWIAQQVINSGTTRRESSLTVSEWAEQKRVLPHGTTSMPGPFSWNVAPYMREIADAMSESSPVERVAVMKSAQITYTVGVLENTIGYIIDAAPGPAIFVSADEQMAQASVELRVDRMIESAGLEGKIRSGSHKRHSKKTGDTKSKKEFSGGVLLAYGPNSGGKLRSFSIQYVLGDEIDAWPQTVGREGDVLNLLELPRGRIWPLNGSNAKTTRRSCRHS